MLVKIKMDKQMSATIDCTPPWEDGVLALGTGNINAMHDNDHYTCFSHLEKKLV
jgi:hypothetical protein